MTRTLPSDAYHALIQTEELFRTLIEESADAIQLLDENGHVIYSSDSVRTVAGYRPDELDGMNPVDYVHPDDLAEFQRKFNRLLSEEGSRLDAQYRVRQKDGSWIWLEATAVNHLHNPAIDAVVGNFRNVTEHKEVEQALADSEARLRFMAESMPQKIFTADSHGIIDYLNPQWSEYTGIPSDKIGSETFGEILHPDDYTENIEHWRHSIATGEPFVYEHRFRAADGTYRWHLTRARAMRNKKGRIVTWVGSSTDIEDVLQAKKRQRHLERQTALLTEQRRQLMELNKAKDEFISLASHQLRTPATAVKQYLGMVLEGYTKAEVPEEIRSFLEVAYESNERQLQIVNDLLKVAYIDAGKVKLEKTPIDMTGLLEEVVRELESILQDRKQKVAWGETSRRPADIDVQLMRMVFENLVDNASKYSPKGKTIKLSVKSAGDDVLISVSDQGVGIDEEGIKSLFEKFSRVDNPLSALAGGTGLGLYWAKQIVRLHKGDIEVESEPGKGSVFTVRIPVGEVAD